ncbi:SPOR domain-containing protein [Candidatus Fukatsuia endosymbiont of Tuberolachnus salignus]|uniref:SPOR domain-containing protein n=1 Tax=Candidatus Fukatsuia endosymbiont of Tuberolachnus salignus TaxID=3077957 RepID=UPI00313E879A
MDDLKPKDDLKADSSDHRPTHLRKSSNGSQLAISHQRMMIGIGILVLLLIVVAVTSALKAPTQHELAQQTPNMATKEVNIPAISSLASNADVLKIDSSHDTKGVKNSVQLQDVRIPPISAVPTDAAPRLAASQTQRIELSGNISDALSAHQGEILSHNTNNTPLSTVPARATTISSSKETVQPIVVSPPSTQTTPKPSDNAAKNLIMSNKNTVITRDTGTKFGSTHIVGSLRTAPKHHFTLQLSSASRADTLNAYAKQQKLTNYQVYETKHDGKSWYILVSGNYASFTEAKSALAMLPADIQAKKTWIKPVYQLQQNLKD